MENENLDLVQFYDDKLKLFLPKDLQHQKQDWNLAYWRFKDLSQAFDTWKSVDLEGLLLLIIFFSFQSLKVAL